MIVTLSVEVSDWRKGSWGISMDSRNWVHRFQALFCLTDVPRVVDDWRAVVAAKQRSMRRFLAAVEQC